MPGAVSASTLCSCRKAAYLWSSARLLPDCCSTKHYSNECKTNVSNWAELTQSRTVRADQAGVVETVVTIPEGAAEPGERWDVLVSNADTGESGLSGPCAVAGAEVTAPRQFNLNLCAVPGI